MENLEQQILELKAEILCRKIALKEAKRAHKLQNKVPFNQTKFGKAYFSTVSTLCKPFAQAHTWASSKIPQSQVLDLESKTAEIPNPYDAANAIAERLLMEENLSEEDRQSLLTELDKYRPVGNGFKIS